MQLIGSCIIELCARRNWMCGSTGTRSASSTIPRYGLDHGQNRSEATCGLPDPSLELRA